jgi:hypothetical protein
VAGAAIAAVDELVAAVKAEVVVGADAARAFFLADDDERLGAEFGDEVVANVADILFAPGAVPDLRPHAIPFQLREVGRGVALLADQFAAEVWLGVLVNGRPQLADSFEDHGGLRLLRGTGRSAS